MKGENVCAMSVACEGKEADHGLMCGPCREEDRAIHDGCNCAVCRSDLALIVPCQNEEPK